MVMPNENRGAGSGGSEVAVYVGEECCHVDVERIPVRVQAPSEAVVENLGTLFGGSPTFDETRVEIDNPVSGTPARW